MGKSFLPKIIVPVFAFAFAFALLYSAYYLFPGFGSFVEKYVPWLEGSGRYSSFGDLSGRGEVVEIPGEIPPSGPVVTPAVEVFYQFTRDSEAYAQDNVNVAYWQNWNWQTHFFWADVIYVDEPERLANLQIGGPDTLGQKDNVSLLCSPENTVSFNGENLTLRKTNFDVFEDLEGGDILYSQCLDEACTSAGNYCFTIKKYPAPEAI